MTEDLSLRFLSLCLALAGTETLHGLFRATVLVPRIGKAKALKLSVVTGSLLAFLVCFLMVPSMGLETRGELITLGVLLALFMASFDLALARIVLKLSWRRALRDFDPRSGNYLLWGLAGLVAWPYIVVSLR